MTDLDPPVIKCPNVKEKTAEPGKVTAKVTWDTPEGKDTADGILTELVSHTHSHGRAIRGRLQVQENSLLKLN